MNQYVHEVQVKSGEDSRRNCFILRTILKGVEEHGLSIIIYNITRKHEVMRVNNQHGEIPIYYNSKKVSERHMLPGDTIEIRVSGDCPEEIRKGYAIKVGNHLEGEWDQSYKQVLFGK